MHCSPASTAQHSAISPHKAAKPVRVDQGARSGRKNPRQADRVGEPAHVVEHLFRALSSQNQRRNKSMPDLQNVQAQRLTQRWCDARRNWL